jgi:hypothetical protein
MFPTILKANAVKAYLKLIRDGFLLQSYQLVVTSLHAAAGGVFGEIMDNCPVALTILSELLVM